MSDTNNFPILEMRSEVLLIPNAFQGKRIEKDEYGYYLRIPMGAVDWISQNNTAYDSKSMGAQIEDPNSPFHKRMISGKLYGEFNHPSTLGYNAGTKEGRLAILERMSQIDMKNVSHHNRNVVLAPVPAEGPRLIYSDVLPYGPYAASSEASLSNPMINTAYSLRALTERIVTVPSNMKHIPKSVNMFIANYLVGFDQVDAGGFEYADKAHIGMENMLYQKHFSFENLGYEFGQAMSLEAISNTEINEILKAKVITRVRNITASIEDTTGVLKSIYGKRELHSALSESLVF